MISRRNFIKSLSSLCAIAGVPGFYAWQIEPFWLEFVEVDMPIMGLPDEHNGRKLMQISDIHVGNRFDYQYIIDSFRLAQKLNPDIVVYTGDYISYESSEQIIQLQEVMQHAVVGSIGTLGVLGNHDYGVNWSQSHVAKKVIGVLKTAGVEVLINSARNLGGINFIGIDDVWGTQFNPQMAMSFYKPSQATIVLCHNPDVCDLPVWNNYNGWVLSGHTHGGQCKPPFLPPPMLPVKNRKYSSGKIDVGDGKTLYINRALGHLWQVRFNVRPEITVFTLRKGTVEKRSQFHKVGKF